MDNEKPVDQLVVSPYFASTIYTIKKEEFLPVATEVFDESVELVKKQSKLNELYPAYMTANLVGDPRLKELSEYIAGSAWNILKSQGFRMADKLTYVTELWGQEHQKHSAMEEHPHAGSQIVGFYFVDVPENSSKIIIHDPRPGKVMSGLPEDNAANVTAASSQVTFGAEAGYLFFANAWLPHSFTRHGSERPLKFYHFNITVQQAVQKDS